MARPLLVLAALASAAALRVAPAPVRAPPAPARAPALREAARRAAGGALAGATLLTVPATALAEASESYAAPELPPPYLPVAFAIFLLAAAGALQLSLGDVMLEEAQLGTESGVKARREMERRQGYFRNK